MLFCFTASPALSQSEIVPPGRLSSGDEAAVAGNSTLAPAPVPVPGEAHARIDKWFVLRTVDGDERPFDDFAGRVLVVNFWATWCGPCVQEMPTLIALAESLADVDVEFLLISIDEDERAVRRFARAHRMERYVHFRGWEPWTSTFRTDIVPATFVVGRNGTIVYEHHGAADWNTDAMRRFLRDSASV